MPVLRKALLLGALCAFVAQPLARAAAESSFVGRHGPLPESVKARMRRYSWREGCPVPLEELALVEVSHWGFDAGLHTGQVVVHQQIAAQVVEIFAELFEARFPIEKLRLIDHYQGCDDSSMADNNSSAFNCRPISGRKQGFSRHSYGVAIDINPLVNPYISASGNVSPPAGARFVERQQDAPGMIHLGGPCHRAFVSRGWTWGGAWRRSKDYHHFELHPSKVLHQQE